MKRVIIAMVLILASGWVVQAQDKGATNAAVAGGAIVKPQTQCPIMGGAINKKLFVDKDGTRIYVCCGGCLAPLKKDFDTIKAKLEKEGVALDKTPVAKTDNAQ